MKGRAAALMFLLLPLLPAMTFADEATEREFAFVGYDVAPFLDARELGAPDYLPLIRLIQEFVAPESWEAAGGEGRIVGVDGKLLVYQQPPVQFEIRRFVILLKAAQATRLPGLQGRPLAPFGNVAIDPFPNNRKLADIPYPLIYPIPDLPRSLPFATERDPIGVAPSGRSLFELLAAVALPLPLADQPGRSILDLPAANCVIVTQTEREHRKLVQLLMALRNSLNASAPQERRTINYRLFDATGKELSPLKLQVIAVRLKTELNDLNWDSLDHFAIADKQLTISQTDEGHRAIYRRLVEWWITTRTDLPLFPPPEGPRRRAE